MNFILQQGRTLSRVAGCLVGLGLLAATPASVLGEAAFRLSGWVQAPDKDFAPWGGAVLMNDPVDRVRGILLDPEQLLAGRLPERRALSVVLLQPRGPADVPVFRVVRDESGPGDIAPSGWSPWTAVSEVHVRAEANDLSRILSVAVEVALDSDGDGIPDRGDEFPYHPWEWADHDRDGTGDNADGDDDNDGMSDLYEQWTGLDPFRPDGAGDADGDGMSNLDEAGAGTLANDAKSRFALRVRLDSRRGRLVITWDGLASRVYGFEFSGSPSGQWSLLSSGFRPQADGVFSIEYPLSPEGGRFFRGAASLP